MRTHIFPAIKLTLLCLIFFSGLYTLSVWGLVQAVPNHGLGNRLAVNGKTYYTDLGQQFSSDRYFWSRPSATGYNAAGSGGSNKGPSNPDYLAQVQARVDSFVVHHPGVRTNDIPVDLVTASGSGLDPDISVEAARIQVSRIAKARDISESELLKLIEANTVQPLWGIFGPTKVRLLSLNLALDAYRK